MTRSIFITIALVGCGLLGEESSNDKSSSGGTSSEGNGTLSGQLETDEGAPDTSIAGATITIANHPGITATSKQDGSFTVKNVPPSGQLEVYAISDNETALLDGKSYGVKFADVQVTPGEVTDLGTGKMKETGTIKGVVDFFENPNNLDPTGIEVYIPGTYFIVKTDSDGNFTLPGLPEGEYTLRLERDGFAVSELVAVKVTSGETNDLGILKLSLSKGPEGRISLTTDLEATIAGNNENVVRSRSVTVNLNFDSDAVLMKVADEPTFLNKSWEPVAKEVSWEFSSDGYKTLYVTFSDLNGLESSPFSVSFYVDTESPTIDTLKLVHGWDQVASTAAKMNVSITSSDAGTGVKEVMYGTDSNFTSNTGWLDYSAEYDQLTVGTVIYAKIRDYAGNESSVSSDTINSGTYTAIASGTYTDALHLPSNLSPFQFSGNLTFTNLTIDAGVTIDHLSSSTAYVITVNGRMRAPGTSGNIIDITSSGSTGFGGFDLSSSSSDDNVIRYFRMTDEMDTSSTFIMIDGGEVSNIEYNPSSGAAPFLEKTGFKSLDVEDNDIDCGSNQSFCVAVSGGSNAVSIVGNTITESNKLIWVTAGTGVTIEYNSIDGDIISATAFTAPGYAIKIDAGTATIRYNDIQSTGFNGFDGVFVYGIYNGGGETITVNNNNIVLDHDNDTDEIRHLTTANTGSAINADFNYFAGHTTTNPNTSGSNITVTNTQGSALSITPGAGCVGAACN